MNLFTVSREQLASSIVTVHGLEPGRVLSVDEAAAVQIVLADYDRKLTIAHETRKMRAAQVKYFAGREKDDLTASKVLERRVDALLEE